MNARAKALIGYIFPALGGLFVTYLYNVVDGIFVGQGVGSAALCADGHICYRAHRETESGQSGIAQKLKNRRRRTARFREAWTALELRTAVSGGKKRKEKNQINGWELIPS